MNSTPTTSFDAGCSAQPICQITGMAALLMACSCSAPSDVSSADHDLGLSESVEGVATGRDEFPAAPALIPTRLDVERETLYLSLDNPTDAGALVSLAAMVENPRGLYFTADAGTLHLAPRSSAEVPLQSLEGLDLAGDPWTDARVSLEYHLDDGRRGGEPVMAFVEHGKVVPPRDVISSGESNGFESVPSDVGLIDKQSGTFRMCFSNAVTLSGTTENNLDYHRKPAQSVFAMGQRLGYTPPMGPHREVPLDGDGCVNLPRVVGTWTFDLFLQGLDWPVLGFRTVARKRNGGIPARRITQSVGSSGSPERRNVTMTAGEDAQLQAAYSTMQLALLRSTSFGNLIDLSKMPALALHMNDTSTEYDHPNLRIYVTPQSAVRRSSVAHEVGHFFHLGWSTGARNSDYSYCRVGDLECDVPSGADGCNRSATDKGHAYNSIEWESAAHVEGMADFFVAMTFNNAFPGADCFIPDANGLSCEAPGFTLASGGTNGGACEELTNGEIFGSVGVEQDWMRMYWDFFADEGQSIRTYLQREGQVPQGWSRHNHYEQIKIALTGSPSMTAAFNRAAAGNVIFGAPH